MNSKKALLTILAVLVVALVVLVAVKNQRNNEKAPVADTSKQNQKQAATDSPQAQMEKQASTEEIPEEIKKIMNDNITGTVEKIDDKSITIKAEDGTTKEMSVAEGKTFVFSQSNGKMENKKISDIKTGVKAYAHFEKETNLATTITLL